MTGADFNPYAAPDVELGPPSPRPTARSAVPRVFGILSIVFSGLMLLPLLGGFTIFAFRHDRPAPVTAETRDTVPGPKTSEPGAAVGLCLGLGLFGGAIALLVLGIGQVRYRRWAARGSVVWSILAPGLIVAGVVLAMVDNISTGLSLIPLTVMLLPYPVLLLVFFTRPRVVQSMA